MSEHSKVPHADDLGVIRKPVVPVIETETEEGPRSPKNDRDTGEINLAETADESEAVRKLVELKAQPEE
jgi:hypothetical protein